MGDVVVDADREMIFGFGLFQVVVDGFHHRRSEFLGGEAVAAADHAERLSLPYRSFRSFVQRVDYVQIQRFANRA